MILVAEYDGEPVAFMMALPDVNEFLRDLDGSLFPVRLGQAAVAASKRMRPAGGRVPLMGVVKRLHSTRLASQLAFMMIERIRQAGTGHYGISRAEVGWILEDNGPDDLDRRGDRERRQPYLPDLRKAALRLGDRCGRLGPKSSP